MQMSRIGGNKGDVNKLCQYSMSRNPVVKFDMAVSGVRLELSPSTSKMVEKLVDL